MNIDKNEIRKYFAEILSLENIRCILHISKRKAAWMLRNGIIKCEVLKKNTRCYRVKIEDFFRYIDEIDKCNKSLRIPTGIFNSRINNPETSPIMVPAIVHSKLPSKFKEWILLEWLNEGDLLTTKDLSRLTGYSQKRINKWIHENFLRSIYTTNGFVSTKEWLIEFFIEKSYKIKSKSSTHISLLKRYYRILE